MTTDDFRLLALGLNKVRMVHQLGNVHFMIGEKVFAALGAPDPAYAVLKLAPEQQAKALSMWPAVFHPQAGGAGARGVTCVRLSTATSKILMPFLKASAVRAAATPGQRSPQNQR